MANIEKTLEAAEAQIGPAFLQAPVRESLRDLIAQDRVFISRRDNALMLEIDNEAYTLPDAFRLSSFP